MALAARLVSHSRQLYSAQAALANGGVCQVRSYAKEAAPADRPPVSGDGIKEKFAAILLSDLTPEVVPLLLPPPPKQVNNFSGNLYQGYASREVAEEKWRKWTGHGRKKKWRSFIVIITALLLGTLVGYVLYSLS